MRRAAHTPPVTIGQFGDLPLQGNTESSGAAFLLRKAPDRSGSVEIDGWTTALVHALGANRRKESFCPTEQL